MLVTDIMQKSVGDIVFPPILERGFSLRKRSNWLCRWCGDRYEVFWFQCDWDKDFGVIEGGLCLGFKSLAKFLKKCGPIQSECLGIANTAQPICEVSRLADLTTPPLLRNGWAVNPDTDPVELGNEISIVCLNGGLAFFERFAAIPPLIDHWKAKRRVKDLFDFDEFQLAAALWLQGDRAEAIRGLEFLVEWRSYSASESPTDAGYFRLDTEVLQWFKSLD